MLYFPFFKKTGTFYVFLLTQAKIQTNSICKTMYFLIFTIVLPYQHQTFYIFALIIQKISEQVCSHNDNIIYYILYKIRPIIAEGQIGEKQ